jgi:hypothetical protein
MSGQPYRYSTDIENFRNDYMKSLELRASLDDANLQANKVFKDTGNLPPVSTMKDNRTTAEVLMDTEKLKINIVGELKGVVPPQMAMEVSQRIQNSPLNADGSFFSWFAQNITELVVQLKKKYRLGIVGDDNDVENMVSFLSTAYTKTKEMGQTTKSAFDRPLSSSNGISENDLSALKNLYDSIQYKLQSKATPTNLINLNLIDQIRQQFDGMSNLLSTNRFNRLRDIFLDRSPNMISQLQINYDGYQDFNDYIEKLPSVATLSTLLQQLDRSTENANSSLSDQILINLSGILPTIMETGRVWRLTESILQAGIAGPIVRPAGTGVSTCVKRRGRPKGKGLVKHITERIDHTKGIKQGHIHVPFGKYILNKNKLDSDLVNIKHQKGHFIQGYPTTKVSKKLGNVLRTIIGGGVPKFEELDGLSSDEKEYLHKVASKAGIMDKLSIPAPSKDKMEQDIHQFEVMKGEILSGNDSPELVKKFKLVLVKLSRNGTIPKREACELLEDLIHLGY